MLRQVPINPQLYIFTDVYPEKVVIKDVVRNNAGVTTSFWFVHPQCALGSHLSICNCFIYTVEAARNAAVVLRGRHIEGVALPRQWVGALKRNLLAGARAADVSSSFLESKTTPLA